ncbi:MAG TPA: hypothetical protein VLM38_12690, partial [Blastocatellia bacterium]|nr:hypothetical protein [Blastocatellia bacterium]
MLLENPRRSSFTALPEKTCVWPATADHESFVRMNGRVNSVPQFPGAGHMLPRRVPPLCLLNLANSL